MRVFAISTDRAADHIEVTALPRPTIFRTNSSCLPSSALRPPYAPERTHDFPTFFSDRPFVVIILSFDLVLLR